MYSLGDSRFAKRFATSAEMRLDAATPQKRWKLPLVDFFAIMIASMNKPRSIQFYPLSKDT